MARSTSVRKARKIAGGVSGKVPLLKNAESRWRTEFEARPRARIRSIRFEIRPIVKFASTLATSPPLIVDRTCTGRRPSSGTAEGLSVSASLALPRAFGFHSCGVGEPTRHLASGLLFWFDWAVHTFMMRFETDFPSC